MTLLPKIYCESSVYIRLGVESNQGTVLYYIRVPAEDTYGYAHHHFPYYHNKFQRQSSKLRK